MIPNLSLNDPDDRHVLATAIHANANVILSADRGFTNTVLEPHNLVVQRTSGFLLGLLNADQDLLLDSLARARQNLRKSTPSPEEFVRGLRAGNQLNGFCDALSKHLGKL